MYNKIGKVKNVLNGDLIEYLLNKYEVLPQSDNGARINADTLVDQDFNKRFNEKLASRSTFAPQKALKSKRPKV